MKTKFLTLNKPCDEKWENMTPNERGSFCASCSKNVIDFTQMSQQEISEIMKKSDGNICARVTSTQLRTPLLNLEDEKKSFRFPYSKVAAGLMLASTLTVGLPIEAKTPNVKTEMVTSSNIDVISKSKKTKPKPKSKNSEFTIFEGIILSEVDSLPIENVKVAFFSLDNIIFSYSDKEGRFSLEIPNSIIEDKNVIMTSYENVNNSSEKNLFKYYQSDNYILNKVDLESNYKIIAENIELVVGGIGSSHDIENPLVIYNGEKIDYDKFLDAMRGKKNSCNLENKDYYFFDSEAAVIIYGEEAQHGLIILTEKPVE
ncbi:MAG: hypothetical protein RIF34_00010 [Candidatus Kapaibacterium sp.]